MFRQCQQCLGTADAIHYLDFSEFKSSGMTRRYCSFCRSTTDNFFFRIFLVFCFSRTSATRSMRGQSWQSGTVVPVVVGNKGSGENETEVRSCFCCSELSCGSTKSTRVLRLAWPTEGGMFVLVDLCAYSDFSSRESPVGELSGDTRPLGFGASSGTERSTAFADGDDLTASSSHHSSGEFWREKRRVWRPGLPMIKFLMGTSAWSTRFDTT